MCSILVLTRKCGQKILIGDNITVELRSIDGRQARIAITAPPEVRIERGEIAGQQRRPKISEMGS